MTDLSPSSGGSSGGTEVTVTGTGLQAGHTTLTLGGTTMPAGSVTVESSTRLTFRTPAHAAGIVGLTVTTSHGLSNQLTYTYTDAYNGARTVGVASTGTPAAGIIELAALLLLAGGGIVFTTRKRVIGRHRH